MSFTEKVCTLCKVNKPIQEFSKSSKALDKHQWHCKSCAKEKIKLYRQQIDYKPKTNEYQLKRRLERKEWAIKYLGDQCAKCGNKFQPHIYDFHHKNPKEKENNLGMYLAGSFTKLKKELDKCILLCANCHRDVHWGEKIDTNLS